MECISCVQKNIATPLKAWQCKQTPEGLLAHHKIIIIMFTDATIQEIEEVMNQAWNAFHVYRKTLPRL